MIDFSELKARNNSYPIAYNTDPQDSDDANCPWLAPGRLLLFVKYETPIDDILNVTGHIDGRALLVHPPLTRARVKYGTIIRLCFHDSWIPGLFAFTSWVATVDTLFWRTW